MFMGCLSFDMFNSDGVSPCRTEASVASYLVSWSAIKLWALACPMALAYPKEDGETVETHSFRFKYLSFGIC